MLKNEILKLSEINNNPQYSGLILDNENDIFALIERLPTIQKIFIAQNLLKEMISIKDLFLDNKKNMLKKLDTNADKFFTNKLLIKQIYDYCEANKPEIFTNYVLLKDKEADEALHGFEENQKNFIENFFFELRNNNTFMLKIIKEIDPEYYDQLGYFLTHFLYINTTSSNFTQEELILMIYLVMEDTIFNKFPPNFSHEFLIKLGLEKEKYFLYYLLKNLTKKTEIRNFISNILHDLILELEDLNKKLTVNINIIIEQILNPHQENIDLNNKRTTSLLNMQIRDDSDFNIKDINKSKSIYFNHFRTRSMMPLDYGFSPNNDKEKEQQNFIKFKSSIKDNDDDINNINNIDIFTFFDENNFTEIELSKIMNNLNKKVESKTEIEKAFWEFLLFIKNEFRKEKTKEIFSSAITLQNLMEEKEKKNIFEEEKDQNLQELYKNNYFIIINFIEKLFDKIFKNLNSLPYTIKCIFFFLDKLISKKYPEKNNITTYQLLMLKLKIFFEGFIIPVLSNPLYNGCVSDAVISNTTLKNLELISLIVEKFCSGNLCKIFNDKTDLYMTIFNKFIVMQMNNFLDMGVEIDKNIKHKFEPPNVVMQLIEFNELNDITVINDMNARNINYDFFNFNKQECIQYQSVGFSFSDLMMFINAIEKQNILNCIEHMHMNHIKSDLDLLMKYKKYFRERYQKNKSENKIEFLLLSNLKYKEAFLNNIKAVTEEHFDNYFKYEKNHSIINEELLLFKKCLIEIIIFINKINKENFNSFIKSRNNLSINNNSHINNYFNHQKLNKYKNTQFEDDINESSDIDINNTISHNDLNIEDHLMKSCLSCDLWEDADFLEEIFPKILKLMKYELGNTSDNERILFCITFLQINIKNLPQECSENNYSKLFTDIIKDILNLLRSLQNNILNQFYLKIREGEKLNLIFSKYSSEIKSMEKYYTINYLFNKLTLPSSKDEHEPNKIINNGSNKQVIPKPQGKSISYFIEKFEDFREIEEEVDDIIAHENTKGIPDMLKKYFEELNDLAKDEKIMMKYSNNEYISSILIDMENYILLKLYKKIFPSSPTKSDEFIYNKCNRLSFIKPENITENKKINENLLLKATEYINKIDTKYTPVDKIKMFGRAFQILENSMAFSSGKSDLGVDDTLPLLIYVLIKSKPKMIYSNLIFCQNYLNPLLNKKEYGSQLVQIGVVVNIICNMKCKELNGVTEEQFGVDEEMPPGLIINKK